ncbi:hypothetical protein MBBAR_20c00030 [Methanobrevibacter arboriphilus JCM 13429 = DSM 1125]|uniref:DUF5518 domain-containing protein n=1 Tax=Methanobrevibacter arboriphilus JCM 13429 = DSM 1125 TaxID=1300164 RepID=A0A1V6N106_METAZ|nr:DUF5518 domain-containing protein [Methanobrevibacter arboriphilus]OQD58324.1 hypothetical protein MBBAR_20c00030 [Methanobrevibacter arboriphilus JCM 13429 = DSM 1125]
MVKWGAVIIGFILAVIVKSLALGWGLETIGLLIIGFIVGYIAKEGTFGGMVNAAVAGSLGTIIAAILFTIIGLFGGLAGFVVFGFAGLIAVIVNLIYYAILMGITGAIGGSVAGDG